jgi:hypothetical protein
MSQIPDYGLANNTGIWSVVQKLSNKTTRYIDIIASTIKPVEPVLTAHEAKHCTATMEDDISIKIIPSSHHYFWLCHN